MRRSSIHHLAPWATLVSCAALLGHSGSFGCRRASPKQVDTARAGQALVSAQVCTSLRRAGAAGTVLDAQIKAQPATKNYGAAWNFNTGPINGIERQTLLKFDLGSIPAGPSTNVTSATVTLTAALARSGPGTIEVHRILNAWSEATVTFQSFAGAFSPSVVTTFSNATPLQAFDVSSLVSAWVRGTATNEGLLLRDPGPNSTNWWSSEQANVSLRPKLDVCYTVTCAAGFADCNDDGQDGCETSIGTPANCGGCGVTCADANPCTTDACQAGVCAHAPAADGTPCDDGDPSTTSDACVGGVCQGASGGGGALVFARVFGDAADQQALGVASDGAGNVVVVGAFEGTIDFGGGPLTAAGLADAFIAKLGPTGNLLFAKRFGSTGDELFSSVAVDAAGNILVAGYFDGTIDLGGGPITNGGVVDGFVAKLDAAGNHIWSKRLGSTSIADVSAVDVDASGNVAVSGAFDDRIDLGGGPLTSSGELAAFVAKLDPAGNHVWSKRFAGTESQSTSGVAFDAAGNVVLLGTFTEAIDLGGGPLGNGAGDNVFVVKLDPGGNHLWSKAFGDTTLDGDESAGGLAVDPAGNVAFAGTLEGTVDFGGGPLTSAGGGDVFVVRLDPAGNHVFSRRFGDTAEQIGVDVAVDAAGNVGFVARSETDLDLGGGPRAGPLLVAKLSTAGDHVWSRGFTNAEGNVLSAGGGGTWLVAGTTSGAVDFGAGPLPNGGGDDAFVTRLGP